MRPRSSLHLLERLHVIVAVTDVVAWLWIFKTSANAVPPLWRAKSSCERDWETTLITDFLSHKSTDRQQCRAFSSNWQIELLAELGLYCHHLLLWALLFMSWLPLIQQWLNFPLVSFVRSLSSSRVVLIQFTSCLSLSLVVNYRADKRRAHVVPRNQT